MGALRTRLCPRCAPHQLQLRNVQRLQHVKAGARALFGDGEYLLYRLLRQRLCELHFALAKPRNGHDDLLSAHGERIFQGLLPPVRQILVLHGERHGKLFQARRQHRLHGREAHLSRTVSLLRHPSGEDYDQTLLQLPAFGRRHDRSARRRGGAPCASCPRLGGRHDGTFHKQQKAALS